MTVYRRRPRPTWPSFALDASGAAPRDGFRTCANVDELEQLKNAVWALDRKSTALELQLAAQTQPVPRLPVVAATTRPSAAKIQDNRTEGEVRKGALTSLDAR